MAKAPASNWAPQTNTSEVVWPVYVGTEAETLALFVNARTNVPHAAVAVAVPVIEILYHPFWYAVTEVDGDPVVFPNNPVLTLKAALTVPKPPVKKPS